ncbi:hypothetical protein D3C83_217630 [compost metagenome]
MSSQLSRAKKLWVFRLFSLRNGLLYSSTSNGVPFSKYRRKSLPLPPVPVSRVRWNLSYHSRVASKPTLKS